MARYSKSYSNYILKKVHTTVNGGTIFERDWSTLGERHVIEPGKKKIYSDGNFLFTDNNMAGLQKRNYTGDWSEPYTIGDLDPNIDGTVNDTSILSPSNDLRDYAYYGSAAELVRVAVEKIVREFPGRLYSENYRLQRYDKSDNEWLNLYSVSSDGSNNYTLTWDSNPDGGLWTVTNPFSMDLYTQDPVLGPNDNRMRSLPLSWKLYLYNGNPLEYWNVWIKPYNECTAEYDVKYEITFASASAGPSHIWGLQYSGGTAWVTDVQDMDIHPCDSVVENYFRDISGLEALLLSRSTDPKYTARFITPFKRNEMDPKWEYVERRYTWPSVGYCIEVGTTAYFNYISRLNKLALTLDELWCDNLWNNMTHEAIKNFDWTYTREYADGDETENILGGTRMQGMLRIMGRFYDDVKRYIDGMSVKYKVTYDGIGNTSQAEVSDRAELMGWEVFSTKEYENMNMAIGQYAYTIPKQSTRYGNGSSVNHSPWYDTSNPEYVDQNTVDNDFMRRLTLSAGHVFRTKGTRHSIDMVMGLFGIGEDDYYIEERYYSVEPKRRDDIFWFYQPNENPEEGVAYQTFTDYPTLESYMEHMHYTLNNTCPEHVMFDDGCYDLRGDMTVGEFCQYLTEEKSVRRNYRDDEFSGVPIKDVYIGNQHVIVPYFSQLKLYDGNVQFETRGGWGKMADEPFTISQLSTQEYDYLETVPYMEVVQKVGELLTINMFDVKGKQIYYVMDISDLAEYTETIPNTVSHFFKLMDPTYPNIFSSWRNVPAGIDVTNPTEFEDYCSETDGNGDPVREIMFGVTYEDWKLARYLDSIMPDNIGNNPHVGFGIYDLGAEYRRYLEKPFKYAAENYGFYDFSICRVAEQFRYEVTEHCGEKIKNLVHGDPMDDDVVNFTCTDDTDDCVTFSCGERYYEPRKLLIIKNNIDSEDYRRYFMDVIIKYLLQVIASTTILVLVGFKPNGECVRFSCEAV